jgi:hypothetical protein
VNVKITFLPVSPTLNRTYNGVLAKWRENGPAAPECEECDHDMTGEDVIDTGLSWICTACASDEHLAYGGSSDYATRMEERRQMGLCDC